MNCFKQLLRTVRTNSPILFWIVITHLILALICIAGLFIDERTLMGVNVWIKPLKFSISAAIYTLTVGYLITLYPYSKIKRNVINNINSWALLLEILIIIYQASRGVQSHYNVTTTFDSILFGLMGLLIGINVLIMILFIFDSIRLKLNTPKSIQLAILLGWIVLVAGSWVGGQMIGQMSHNVGIADGGVGLPLVNWSTVGGDLRIAHFFGLHGIQIIPLFGLLISKKWKTTSRNQLITVTVFGVLYATWISYMFYQAKQGMPLISF